MADLTQERKEAVQASWGLVRQNMRENAMAFFQFFFKTHPAHQNEFTDFKGKNVDDLPNVPKFRGHAVRVFFALSSLVDNLDDLSVVVDITQKTARDHYPRGIRGHHYQDLFSTVLAFLEKALGDNFDPITKEGWETVANVLLQVVNDELKVLEA